MTGEGYLLRAFSKLPERHQITSNLNGFKLQFGLAKLYLKGVYYERGIILLENLFKLPHPRGKTNKIIYLLSYGYYKNRNFVECEKLLIPFVLENEKIENENKKIKFFLLAIKNYVNLKKYKESIKLLDQLIVECKQNQFNLLGNYFYLRGKIFSNLVKTEDNFIKFPWKLNETDCIYLNYTDFLQEGIECFKKSNFYYFSMKHDSLQFKSSIKFCEVQLDYLFIELFYNKKSIHEITKLNQFELSNLLNSVSIITANSSSTASLPNFHKNHSFYEISIPQIEDMAKFAEDIVNHYSISFPYYFFTYLNLSELEIIKKNQDKSYEYWKKCKNYLLNYFLFPVFSGNLLTPGYLEDLLKILKRLIRLALFYNNENILINNLFLIDIFNLIQITLDFSKNSKNYIKLKNPNCTNSFNDLLEIHSHKKYKKKFNKKVQLERLDTEKRLLKEEVLAKIQVKKIKKKENKFLNNYYCSHQLIFQFLKEDKSKFSEDFKVEKNKSLSNEYIGSFQGILHCLKSILSNSTLRKGKAVQKEDIKFKYEKYFSKLKSLSKIYEKYFILKEPLLIRKSNKKNGTTLGQTVQIKVEGLESETNSKNSVENRVKIKKFTEISHNIQEKLLYLLYLDNNIISFSPSARKLQIGIFKIVKDVITHVSKNGSIERGSSSELLVNSSDQLKRTKKTAANQQEKIPIIVELLSNNHEKGKFMVDTSLMLNEFIDFFYHIENYNKILHQSGSISSGGSGSLNDNQSKQSKPKLKNSNSTKLNKEKLNKFPIKLIEYTKNFMSEIIQTISPKNPTNFPLKLNFLIKKNDKEFLLLNSFKEKSIFEILEKFKKLNQENLRFFLYFSYFPKEVYQMIPTRFHFDFKNSLNVNSDFLQLIRRLIKRNSIQTEDFYFYFQKNKKSIENFNKNLIFYLREIFFTNFSFKNSNISSIFNSEEIVRENKSNSLIIIASKTLHNFPWELILNENMIRSFSLSFILNSLDFRSFNNSFDPNYFPTFFAFNSHSFDQKQTKFEQEERKTQTFERFLNDFHLKSAPVSVRSLLFVHKAIANPFNHQVAPAPVFPLHCLSARKKYKFIHFFLDDKMTDPQSLIHFFNNLPMENFNIVISSYSDLLELNELTATLTLYTFSFFFCEHFLIFSLFLRCVFNATILFVPHSHIKSVVGSFVGYHTAFLQSKSMLPTDFVVSKSDYLLNLTQTLQREYQIPIILFNLP